MQGILRIEEHSFPSTRLTITILPLHLIFLSIEHVNCLSFPSFSVASSQSHSYGFIIERLLWYCQTSRLLGWLLHLRHLGVNFIPGAILVLLNGWSKVRGALSIFAQVSDLVQEVVHKGMFLEIVHFGSLLGFLGILWWVLFPVLGMHHTQRLHVDFHFFQKESLQVFIRLLFGLNVCVRHVLPHLSDHLWWL